MNQNTHLKASLPILFIFVSSVVTFCSPKETVVEDCRKSDNCPVTYGASLAYPEDENGKSLPSVYLDANSKILILTDKEGKIQNGKGANGSSRMKVLLNGQEVYLSKYSTSYESYLRNLDKKGTMLYAQPDKKSTFAGNLPYNSSAKIINQTGPIDSPTTFIKIVSGKLTGWAEKRSFTDGDYDAALHKKSIDDLVADHSVNAVAESDQITIAWTGTDYQNATCILNEEPCTVSHSFGEAAFGKKEEALNFLLTKTSEATKYNCQIRRVDFIDAYASAENKTLSPYLGCDKVVEEESYGID